MGRVGMEVAVKKMDKETLVLLYSEYGIRCKEIGEIFGVSEDAVLKKLKSYKIETLPRGYLRKEVSVILDGRKKSERKLLSDDLLKNLCLQGKTDLEIGTLFNLTGEGVAYRRKKLGIDITDKFNETREAKDRLFSTSKNTLEEDYYNLTQEEISRKYRVSKVIWRPYLRSLRIIEKNELRINSFPPFNKDQRILLFGSLLGDGGISKDSRYYESHALKQRKYLGKKYDIMKPFSARIFPCDNGSGMRITSVSHPYFKEFRNYFYGPGINGKLIPVDRLIKEWDDQILAYWFFDDGYLDDRSDLFCIANKCPVREQLDNFVDFLESRYGWGFKVGLPQGTHRVTFSKHYKSNLAKILCRYATPDVYYKIPEGSLSKEMVSEVDMSTISEIKPKFYRLAEPGVKASIEKKLFDHYRQKGFPYSSYTEKRLKYILESFLNLQGKVSDGVFSYNNAGLSLCDHFFPNLYESRRKGKRSPLERWHDDESLLSLIRNRLENAPRISDSSMRTGIKLQFNAVSNFKPIIAKYIYSKYAESGRVFDYSCGFGARMLAAMSLGMEYGGCEPNLKTKKNLEVFGAFLSKHTGGKFDIVEEGSEECIVRERYYDIAFSSPPFFDYEIYSQDPGQSIVKYPTYDEWLIRYWKKTIFNCTMALRLGGYFGACLSLGSQDSLIQSTVDFCSGMGLKLVEQLRAPYKQVYNKNNDRYDLILIYKMC